MPAAEVLLDKILAYGTTYKTKAREILIIKKVGTNSTSGVQLKIDGKQTTKLISDLAPMHVTSSNKWGLLDLGDLYNVVLPEVEVELVGTSGDKVRIVGKKLILAPGEAIPSELVSRADMQHKAYVTYLKDSYSHGTDAAWAPGDENDVITLTPASDEKYIFDSRYMAKLENASATITEGDFATRFFLQTGYLEYLVGENIQPGIDILSTPYPPSDSTEETGFLLKDRPIEVPGDQTFKVVARNTSGGNITPTSGASLTVTAALVAKFYKGV